MGEQDPLALFPLEIWEMILDRVMDSETVYSVLKMFPQLDGAFQKKKHVWILGKILPFITTWTKLLEEEELLKLRLGCKNWIKQVDNFLENQQPQLRPYHPDLQTDDQFRWNSKAHLQQHLESSYSEEKSYFGGVKFVMGANEDQDNKLAKFLEGMGTHPEGRNPFLARSLSVDIDICDHQWIEEEVAHFLQKVLEILEKFGSHIWFFSIQLCMEQRHRSQTRDWVRRSLPLLPNLKSLDLRVSMDSPLPNRRNKFKPEEGLLENCGSEQACIDFPSLESLRVSVGIQTETLFAHRILGSITSPIKRLVLDWKIWKDEYSRLLSTVTELKLEGIEITSSSWTRFRNLMLSMEAPQLVKLELNKTPPLGGNRSHIFMEDEIFPMIKRFPSLKYFDIGTTYKLPFLGERGTMLPERDSLPSLQFLVIRDSIALSYDFVRCLPSLQHLQIHTDSEPKVVDLSNEKVVKIREQIETGTMHRSNIWELLPTLRSVTIVSGRYNPKVVHSCDREKYNYFKEHPDYGGFEDFREDIVWHLYVNQRRFVDRPSLTVRPPFADDDDSQSADSSSDDDPDPGDDNNNNSDSDDLAPPALDSDSDPDGGSDDGDAD